MISIKAFRELVDTYKKFGWVLRRLVLLDTTLASLADELATVDSTIVVRESSIDAVWFARPTEGGITAWELRSLADSPFAILEHLDENDPDFEAQLRDVEDRMASDQR